MRGEASSYTAKLLHHLSASCLCPCPSFGQPESTRGKGREGKGREGKGRDGTERQAEGGRQTDERREANRKRRREGGGDTKGTGLNKRKKKNKKQKDRDFSAGNRLYNSCPDATTLA
jgi:hypothetical protein